jgi:arsenite-transporting ATPase
MQAPEYDKFSRIVFDTAPTVSCNVFARACMVDKSLKYRSKVPQVAIGLVLYTWATLAVLTLSLKICQGHTLRLLSLPDFLDASIGKILKVQSSVNLSFRCGNQGGVS